MNVNKGVCMYCGVCVGLCPQGAVTLFEAQIRFGPACNSCGMCVKGCPVGAITRS